VDQFQRSGDMIAEFEEIASLTPLFQICKSGVIARENTQEI